MYYTAWYQQGAYWVCMDGDYERYMLDDGRAHIVQHDNPEQALNLVLLYVKAQAGKRILPKP